MSDASFKYRGSRCDHGMYKGDCAMRFCAHWDGYRSDDEAARKRRDAHHGGYDRTHVGQNLARRLELGERMAQRRKAG